ncbi:hypothetical protein BHE74_00037408 [Ensete ventricosum]|nr:hypothetical protein BHE74_00037408 [Ensete ventricosum]
MNARPVMGVVVVHDASCDRVSCLESRTDITSRGQQHRTVGVGPDQQRPMGAYRVTHPPPPFGTHSRHRSGWYDLRTSIINGARVKWWATSCRPPPPPAAW